MDKKPIFWDDPKSMVKWNLGLLHMEWWTRTIQASKNLVRGASKSQFIADEIVKKFPEMEERFECMTSIGYVIWIMSDHETITDLFVSHMPDFIPSMRDFYNDKAEKLAAEQGIDLLIIRRL